MSQRNRDPFLNQHYETLRHIHANLEAIKKVAEKLVPISDVEDFATEIEAVYSRLGLLVEASELMIQVTDAGFGLITAENPAQQRALLELGTAALHSTNFFASSTDFLILKSLVQTMSAVVDQAVLDIADRVKHDEMAAALAPILTRLLNLETTVTDLSDRIGGIEGGLGDGSYFGDIEDALAIITARLDSQDGTLTGISSALLGLGSRVDEVEDGLIAQSNFTVALTSRVSDLETGVAGQADALNVLTTQVALLDDSVSSQAASLLALSAQVTSLNNDLALAADAIQAVETLAQSTAAEQLALSSAVTGLTARVVDAENQTALVGTAVESLTTRVELTENALTIQSEDITQLQSSITGTGNLLVNSAFAGGPEGWTLFSRGAGWLGAQLGTDLEPERTPPAVHTLSLSPSGVPSGDAGVRTENLPVEALQAYIVSGYLAGENCTVRLEWRLFNAALVQIDMGMVGEVTDTAPANNIQGWTRVHDRIPIPTDGAVLQVQWWVVDAHTAPPKAWLMMPMLERAIGNQQHPSPWVPDSNGTSVVMAEAIETLRTELNQIGDDLQLLSEAQTDLSARIGMVTDYYFISHSGSGTHTSVGSPHPPQIKRIWLEEPEVSFVRGMTLILFNPDGSILSATPYDTYATSSARTALAADLNALTDTQGFFLISRDNHGIKNTSLTEAIERCGGFLYRDILGSQMYALLGMGGIGKGRGLEWVEKDLRPWVEGYFTLVNDQPKGLGENNAVTALGQAVETLSTEVTQIGDDLEAVSSQQLLLVARVGDAEAAIEDEATVRADNDGLLGDRIETMELRMPTGNGELATTASLSSIETASVSRDEALGTRIDTIEVSVPVSTSIVRKSSFEDGKLGLWAGANSENVAVSTHPSASRALKVSGTVYEGSASAALPAKPGDVVDVSVDINANSATGSVLVLVHWINAAGGNAGFSTVISVTGGSGGWQIGLEGATPEAPASTVAARVGLVPGTAGSAVFTNIRAAIRGDGENAVRALISDESSARASGDSALSTRIGTVEARMPAEAGVLATSASVSLVESASVSRDEALGSRIGVVEARMPAGTGPLATNAQIITEQQARADAVSAVASDLSALGVTVGDQGASLTQIAKVTGSINAVVVLDPSFEIQDGSWSMGPGMTITYSSNAARTGNYYLDADAGTGTRLSNNTGRFRVEAGQQIRLWTWLRWGTSALSGNGPTFGLVFFNEDGVNLGANQNVGIIPNANITSTFKKFEGIVTVPPNAATANFYIAARHTSGGRLLVDDAGGEFITDGEAKFLASHTMTLDVNGLITGWRFANDGSTGTADFRADRFSVTSPSGTSGLSWVNGALWNRRGSYSFITSDTLGENMMVYIGPTPSSPGAAKRADALFYVDSSGTGYFAGQVLQGIIRTFKSSTAQGNVTVTGDATSSNGKEVALKAVVNRQSFQQYNGANANITPGGGLTRVRVRIQRRYGSGAWADLADQYVTGSMEWFSEPGAGAWVNWRLSGEVLATDTASTANRQYRVVLSEMTFQSHNVTNPGTIPAEVRNQYTSIESLE